LKNPYFPRTSKDNKNIAVQLPLPDKYTVFSTLRKSLKYIKVCCNWSKYLKKKKKKPVPF
jgi:hypothetical protein